MMNVHGQYVIYHPRDLTFLVLMAKRCLSNRRWWRRLEKTNAPSSITECAESAWRESWNAFQEAKKYAETVTVSKNEDALCVMDMRHTPPRVVRDELLGKSFVTKYSAGPSSASYVVDDEMSGFPVWLCDSQISREQAAIRRAYMVASRDAMIPGDITRKVAGG